MTAQENSNLKRWLMVNVLTLVALTGSVIVFGGRMVWYVSGLDRDVAANTIRSKASLAESEFKNRIAWRDREREKLQNWLQNLDSHMDELERRTTRLEERAARKVSWRQTPLAPGRVWRKVWDIPYREPVIQVSYEALT